MLAEGLDLCGIDRANDVEQAKEHGLRVRKVIQSTPRRRGPHRLDVEADALAVLAVAVLLERPDLVERPAQVDRAEDLVLVVFQAVLVVQVNAPELAVIEGDRPCRRPGRGRPGSSVRSRSGRPSGSGSTGLVGDRRSCGRRSAGRPDPSARWAWPRPGRGCPCRARGSCSRHRRSGRRPSWRPWPRGCTTPREPATGRSSCSRPPGRYRRTAGPDRGRTAVGRGCSR